MPRHLLHFAWVVGLAISSCSLDREGSAASGGSGGVGGTGGTAGTGGGANGGTGANGGIAGTGGKAGTGGTSVGGEGGSTGGTGPGGSAGSTGGTGATAGVGAIGGAAGATGGTGGSPLVCPDAGGMMIALDAGFCIDSTEVTRAQYASWLSHAPPVASQPAACSWNDSFTPLGSCMNHPKDVCQGDCDGHPQVCVDWCDAYAYCQAHGKRLCGRVGGGSADLTTRADATVDQWFHACSSNAANAWTFGNAAPMPPYPCNYGHNSDTYPTVAGASLSGCQSTLASFGGVYDLNGNAAEWQDACNADAGKDDMCALRGGSYDRGQDSNRCDTERDDKRDAKNFATGFRCCWP